MFICVYVCSLAFRCVCVCVYPICTLEHIIGLLYFKYYSVATQGKRMFGEDWWRGQYCWPSERRWWLRMMAGGWREMDTLRTYLADKFRSTCWWVRCREQERMRYCGWTQVTSGCCSWLGGGPTSELGNTRSGLTEGLGGEVSWLETTKGLWSMKCHSELPWDENGKLSTVLSNLEIITGFCVHCLDGGKNQIWGGWGEWEVSKGSSSPDP